MQSRHPSVVIAAPPAVVSAFIRDPGNLPRWAEGLATMPVRVESDDLVIDTSMGEMRVRFVTDNPWGIVDHDVTTPGGVTQNNPMRVLVHPQGSEVVISVRQLALTDEEFDRDCAQVQSDLERLRALLEA